MRVLYIEAPLGFGGSLTGLLHLFGALPSRVEPILATSFDPRPYIDLPPNLVHRHIVAPPKSAHGGSRLRGLLRYYREDIRPWQTATDRLIQEFKPDLVHANNSAIVNLGAAWGAAKHGVPAISHQKGFEYVGPLAKWVVRHSGFTHHIATSGAIAKHLFGMGLNAARCTTIYEPVVGPRVEPAPRDPDNLLPVVGMHSILTPWKGQHVVLQAIARLVQRGTTAFRVQIAGAPPGGDVAYLEQLKQQVDELAIASYVTFVGHQRDVYQFLQRIDIAVHASIEPEPFGRVAAEAMLSGLPTLVTANGGPAEYVKHGVTGLHVPCNDPEAMTDALQRLLASPQERSAIGQAARQYAVQEFDAQRLTQKVVDIYDQVLS